LSRGAVVAFLLFTVLGTSGCTTLFKDDYWDEIHKQSDKDESARLRDDPASSFFLGVRAPANEVPYQLGIPVQHVYAESPAAKAGLREGDEIRSIGGNAVRTPGDARVVLAALYKTEEEASKSRREHLAQDEKAKPEDFVPRSKTRILYARDGREIDVEIELTSHEGYLDLRRRRVLELSHYEQDGYNGWYFWKRRTIPPDFVQAYFGMNVTTDVLVAQDLDILPAALGISLVRVEKAPVADATRVTVICSLLQFSSRGDDVARTLSGLIPDAPQGTTDL
jgi:hypothetical protein